MYLFNWDSLFKTEKPVRSMELQEEEEEAQKRLKHTENVFGKNLQLKGVC